MRLVSKLTLLLMLGIAVVLIVDGTITVRREVDLFDTDMQTDTRLYGGMFASAVEEVWDLQGETRALELVGHADAQHLGVQVRWVWLDGDAEQKFRPHAPELARNLAMAKGGSISGDVEDDTGERIVTYVRVHTGGRVGAIELSEPVRKRNVYIATTIRRVALLVAITVLICAVLSLVLGAVVVGRPVRALVARTREIGEGTLSGSLNVRQRDEFGTLAAEIDSMARSLEAAAERLSTETNDRLLAEQQLRHAERLATIGTLAAGVAHELGTPLNIVAERATMIQRDQVPTAEVPDNARIIREQAQRMTRTIRQLLDFAGHRPIHKARHDVRAILRETAKLLGGFAAERDVTVDIECADESRIVAELDREQIRQAMTNLTMNALQACSPGGSVRILLDTIQTREAGPQVRIQVVDTGVGILADDLPRVFEPFFTTKDVGVGTGLGLSVTLGIVRDHDGTIDVESEPGEGTRVAILLPATGR